MCSRHLHGCIGTFQRQHRTVIGIDLGTANVVILEVISVRRVVLTVVSLVTVDGACPISDLGMIDESEECTGVWQFTLPN